MKSITVRFTPADADIAKYIDAARGEKSASEFVREIIREKAKKDKLIGYTWPTEWGWD